MNLFLLISWFATWYSLDGNYTSSGEVFDSNKMTCASNHYKIGTLLEVTNVANGKSLVVKVNDTGAFRGYKLDLSKGAFSKIADLRKGVIKIKVEKFNEL